MPRKNKCYSDELLREGVELANIPALAMTLVQMTGDKRWLYPPFNITNAEMMDDNDSGGLPDEQQRAIRQAAYEAIRRWLDGARPAIETPDAELCVELLSRAMGEAVPPPYGPMLRDAYAGTFGTEDHAPTGSIPERTRVLIIGAGISGLCAAAYLQQSGIPFKIMEKNDGVGGDWLVNRYPGAGVDVASHYYSFGFMQYDWPMYFGLRDDILAYLKHVASTFDLIKHIQLRTQVLDARYDEENQEWLVRIKSEDGIERIERARFVISAVGIFNPPKMPAIPSIETFEGPVFHTADWPQDYDIAGKNVVLIGNGASAMQVGPAIQDKVSSLTIFQRSPHWIVPFPMFRKAVSDALRKLMTEVPMYAKWYRAGIAWRVSDSNFPVLQKDPSWPHPDRSLNQANEDLRLRLGNYIKSQLIDRPDLIETVTPRYPPWGKRMLRDNGWYAMLKRSNVKLITESAVRVTKNGVETASGDFIHADAIICATGFDVQCYLSSFDVFGRGGEKLRDIWGVDNPKAYMGGLIPKFPNFFVLYGPNSQPGHGGSLMYVVEMQMHYFCNILHQVIADNIGAVEIGSDVTERYNDLVDEAGKNKSWAHPSVDSYYKNSEGRIVVNYPFPNLSLFENSRKADLQDFLVEPARG